MVVNISNKKVGNQIPFRHIICNTQTVLHIINDGRDAKAHCPTCNKDISLKTKGISHSTSAGSSNDGWREELHHSYSCLAWEDLGPIWWHLPHTLEEIN